LGIALNKGNALISLNLTRDFVDKQSAGNNIIAKMMYTLQRGNFVINPTFYYVAFDKQMGNSLFAPAISASYTGALKVDAMIGYGFVFKNPNTIVSSLTLSKTLQEYTFKVCTWENWKADKATTTLALQMSKKVYVQNGVALSVEGGYHWKDIFENEEHFGWLGVSVNF
jgi:hypothetical protein